MNRGRIHAHAAAGLAALGFLLLAAAPAWANPTNTSTTIAFDPASPVTEGTLVDITGTTLCAQIHGTFCDAVGKPLTIGSIQIQQARDGGDNPVACAGQVSFVQIASGAPVAGDFTLVDFNTAGLGGQTIGFRAHFPSVGGPHQPGQSSSSCLDLVIETAEAEVDPISIVKTRTEGPLDRDGNLIDPVDSQNLTVIGDDAGGIWIGLVEPQRYVFTIEITNNTGETLDDLTVTDVIPADYNFDPVLQEDAADGTIDAICDDGICDGEDTGGIIDACDDPSIGGIETVCTGFTSDVSECMVAATQPDGADAGPKGEVPLGQRFKEPELLTLMVDGLADTDMCAVTLYVITDGNPGHVTEDGVEQCHPDIASFFANPGTLEDCVDLNEDQILAFDLYEPTSCRQIKTVDHDDNGATDAIPINDTIALNEGIKAFLVEPANGLPAHGARQFGPSSSLQLTANGCDADEDGVQDLEDACPLTEPETDQIDPDGDGCWVDPAP